MKTLINKILIIVSLIIISLLIYSQSPQGFYYQAQIRDAAGKLLKNDDVTIKISLLEDGLEGDIIYSETHNVITTHYGAVNLVIGDGIAVTGNFSDLSWSESQYYIQLEVDETGGNEYRMIGTSQILSVPYALYAEKAGNTNNLWNNTDDLIFNMDYSVGLGTNTITDTSNFKKTKLEINYTGTNSLNIGEKRALRTYIDINDSRLTSNIQSSTGMGFIRNDRTIGFGTFNEVINLNYMNAEVGEIVGVTGAQFDVEVENINYGSGTGQYNIFGSVSRIYGSDPGDPPGNQTFSALLAFDQIEGVNTFAGYFLGRSYFSNNVGIGIDNPQRILHISNVMRLEPRTSEPASPQPGDMYIDSSDNNKLKVWDGSIWQSCW